MHARKVIYSVLGILSVMVTLPSCTPGYGSTGKFGTPNMGSHPTPEARDLAISSEPTGAHFYGRRYFVDKTRFWGYLRKPRQPWSQAELIVINESQASQPDRLPEDGPIGSSHGYDQNFEYKITGAYSGRRIYDPASNLFIREFRPTSFTVINTNPGWLFSPEDHYNPRSITLINGSVRRN